MIKSTLEMCFNVSFNGLLLLESYSAYNDALMTERKCNILPEEAGGKDVVLKQQSYTGYISGDEHREP